MAIVVPLKKSPPPAHKPDGEHTRPTVPAPVDAELDLELELELPSSAVTAIPPELEMELAAFASMPSVPPPAPPPRTPPRSSGVGTVRAGDTSGEESGVFAARISNVDALEKLGSLDRVPIVRISADELRALPLDPVAGFLVSQMDGMLSIESLLDLAPMPRSDVLRALCLLLDYGVISLH